MKSRNPLSVEVLRGPVVESVHQVMTVVTDEKGTILASHGNPEYLVYPRSAVKMIQAIPFAESGAMEKFELDDRMLALACSSHRAEKVHLAVVAQWMEKMKVSESILQCGPAYPTHEATAYEMIRKSLPPTPVCHNCSGKHLGLVATCLVHGDDPAHYHQFDHISQKRLRKVMTEFTRIDHEKAPWGVDGCGIPTVSIPLQNLSMSMSAFLRPTTPARKLTTAKILDAWKKHPGLVGGSDDLIARINDRTRGRALLKSGAEGVFTGLIPERGYGFALKVVDGSSRAAGFVAATLFKQWGGLTDEEYQDLKKDFLPEVKNARGEKVGAIRLAKG